MAPAAQRERISVMPPSDWVEPMSYPPGYDAEAKGKVFLHAFQAFDVGRSGRIAPWDFERACASLNLDAPPDEVVRVAEACADADTGMIDYVNFIKALLA